MIMSICFSYLRKLFEPNYPKDIRQLLNREYKKIHRHEKKIRNIRKNCHSYKILWWVIGDIDPENLLRLKRHKYIINKANKQIYRIKKYYRDYYK